MGFSVGGGEKFHDALLRAPDDGPITPCEHGALQKLLVLEKNIHNRARIVCELRGFQPEFFEFRVFAHQVFDRVFKRCDNIFQIFAPGRFLDVEDDSMCDSQFPGDRQGIFRGASVGIMIYEDFLSHGRLCLRYVGGGRQGSAFFSWIFHRESPAGADVRQA